MCKHAGVQPSRPGPKQLGAGRRCALPAVFLFGSARSYFWSGVGLSLGRSRVSSLAFAPSAEKQVRMQRTRVSEQLPKLRNQAVSKAEEGRRGAAGGGGQGRCFGGRRSSPGWGAGRVGDVQASGVPLVGIGVQGRRGRGYPPVDDNGRSGPLGGLGWRKVRMLGLGEDPAVGVGARREGC